MQFLSSLSASWLRHMNMPPIYYRFCKALFGSFQIHEIIHSNSADLEITVPMLVQVDKLVQLIESPVFTCEVPAFVVNLTG